MSEGLAGQGIAISGAFSVASSLFIAAMAGQPWIARTFPDNAKAGGGLLVAVLQLAIALGSTVGGLLFDRSGYQSTFAASAGLLLAAALLTGLTARAGAARPA